MTLSERRTERIARLLSERLASVTVIVEAVRRRHNTSAILRSAEAFGLHEVHLVTGDFHPSRGAARGAERWLEIHRHATVTEAIAGLRARGFRVYAADPVPDAITPDAVPVDQPVAVLFGSELAGVSPEARALADGTVAVPMRGLTESLNVSVAAGLVLHPVAERRRALLGGGDIDPARAQAFYERWLEAQLAAEAAASARHRVDLPEGEDLELGFVED